MNTPAVSLIFGLTTGGTWYNELQLARAPSRSMIRVTSRLCGISLRCLRRVA